MRVGQISEERQSLLDQLARLGQDMGTVSIVLHDMIAERLGLNITDHKALGVLARDGAMTAGKLAEAMNVTTGAVTGIVDRLEAAGYAVRKVDPADRRRVVVEAVAERLAEVAPRFAPFKNKMDEQCSAYTNDELRLIVDFLEGMTQRMRQMTTSLRDTW